MAPDGNVVFCCRLFNLPSFFQFEVLLKAILGICCGLLRTFEGLLQGVLGHIKAKALVMLACSGA